MKIRQALISVSDKTGIVAFARSLADLGIEILSTGGTAKTLADAGIKVIEVAQYTGQPEILDGRVKTLHPKIHAGILARRDLPEHTATLQQHEIAPIDLVCINLYPFQATVCRPDVTLEQAIENIDIGGPAMVRAAAKNYTGVAVVTDPSDYDEIISELVAGQQELSLARRFALAKKAFTHTARYDGAIANWLTSLDENDKPQLFSEKLHLAFDRSEILRYGENPHQSAAFYRDPSIEPGVLAGYTQLQGKPLSYNNLADADAAWECVKAFAEPAAVIVKHANPCGVAIAGDLRTAYKKAFQTDPTSAFGGIIAFNGTVDNDVIEAMNERKHFVEVLIAPAFTPSATAALAAKTNLRVLTVPLPDTTAAQAADKLEMKRIGGGLLVQTADDEVATEEGLRVVSRIVPTAEQLSDLIFASRVAQFVKSNAIVFCGGGMTLGIGAGQMSRVDSTRIAALKAGNAGLALADSCVASDAFFPFRDGVDVLAQAGAKAVIQPGGSIRDEEVIAAADEHGLVMVFTGVRHFRH